MGLLMCNKDRIIMVITRAVMEKKPTDDHIWLHYLKSLQNSTYLPTVLGKYAFFVATLAINLGNVQYIGLIKDMVQFSAPNKHIVLVSRHYKLNRS